MSALIRRAILPFSAGAALVGYTVLPATTAQESPPWFKATPKDTSQFRVGTGSGYNRQSAMAQALADVATRLKTTVQSQTIVQGSKVMSGSNKPVTDQRTDILDKLTTGAVAFPGWTTTLQSGADRERTFMTCLFIT